MPAISVIVPVYNAENYIVKCWDSIKKQTFQDFEVIFVNDGSNDQSVSMLEEIASSRENVIVLSQENQGQAIARNNGIKKTNGEFICFVDIDDYIHEEMLQKLYETQQETKADIVWCNAFLVKEDTVIGNLDDPTCFTKERKKDYILHNAGPCRKLIRKSIMEENHLSFPSIRFYEDLAVAPLWGIYANTIAYVKEPLYYYVLHEGSTMHQLTYNTKLECIFDCMEYLQKGFQQQEEVFHEELEFLYIEHLLHAASLRFFAFEEGKKHLDTICHIMKKQYPNWQKNQYYKAKDWKYKLVCHLFYHKRYFLLKRMIGE